MLSTISFPFVLATAYWTLEVAQEIVRMHTYFIDRSLRYSPNITDYGKLFDSIVLLNVSHPLSPSVETVDIYL